jgi:hypothetical protein
MAAELPFQDVCSLPLSPSACLSNSGAMFRQFLYGVYSGPAQHSVVSECAQQFSGSVFPTALRKEARLGTPPRFPAVVAAGQIYQRRSRERRSDRAGGTMSALSLLSIPTVFSPIATSAQRTPTGLRVV